MTFYLLLISPDVSGPMYHWLPRDRAAEIRNGLAAQAPYIDRAQIRPAKGQARHPRRGRSVGRPQDLWRQRSSLEVLEQQRLGGRVAVVEQRQHLPVARNRHQLIGKHQCDPQIAELIDRTAVRKAVKLARTVDFAVGQ